MALVIDGVIHEIISRATSRMVNQAKRNHATTTNADADNGDGILCFSFSHVAKQTLPFQSAAKVALSM